MELSILEWKSMAWSGNELILCLTSAQRDQRACRAGLKVDMKLIETCASRFFVKSDFVCEALFGVDLFGTWEPSGFVSPCLHLVAIPLVST
jgi:hypothetical protein